MNSKRYKLLPIFISLIASIIIGIKRSDENVFSIFGGTLSLIFGPYIFSSLIRHGLKLSLWNWNFEDKSFLKTYIIIWCIFVF